MPRRKRVKVIFTLDLDTRGRRPNYYRLNREMDSLGLRKFTPRNVAMPHNTYYGEFIDENLNISELRRGIWAILRNLNLNPRRLFGGILTEWSLRSPRRRTR